jgi:hypothetical protein
MNQEFLDLVSKYKSNAEEINDVNFQSQLEGMGDIKDITKFLKMVTVISKFRANADIATDLIRLLADRLKEFELKPPCHECGFEGGDLYANAFEDFNNNRI